MRRLLRNGRTKDQLKDAVDITTKIFQAMQVGLKEEVPLWSGIDVEM